MKMTVDFQVELDNPEDRKLLATVKKLKHHHKFTPTLREALALILDLRGGSTVVLFELFPWMAGQGTAPTPPAPPPPPPIDQNELAKEIAAQIVLQGGINPISMQSAQPQFGPKQLNAATFELPSFEDDDLEIETKAADPMAAVHNFMKGMQGLHQ